MKVLMLFHAPPWPPDIGPSRRNYHVLVETLRRHDVSFVSLGTAADRDAFQARFGGACRDAVFVENPRGRIRDGGRSLWLLARGRSDFHRLYRRDFQRAVDRLAETRPFDVAYASTAMLGCYRLPRHVPIVGDTHNVEHDILARAAREAKEPWRRLYYRTQSALTRREEVRYASSFSLMCATSRRDRRLLEELAPQADIALVPNGIDLDKYRPDWREPQRGSMLFTGLMSYYPNAHGVRRFVDRVLPRIRARVPFARLRIVGANPPASVRALASDAVEVIGRVPDVRPYYGRAEIAIVPLWIGGGTRVKILEAMAQGVPVVSTPVGAEGLDVSHGRDVLIGATEMELADAAVAALTQPTLRRTLASEGLRLAHEYDWRRIGVALEAVFRRAARSGAHAYGLQALHRRGAMYVPQA